MKDDSWLLQVSTGLAEALDGRIVRRRKKKETQLTQRRSTPNDTPLVHVAGQMGHSRTHTRKTRPITDCGVFRRMGWEGLVLFSRGHPALQPSSHPASTVHLGTSHECRWSSIVCLLVLSSPSCSLSSCLGLQSCCRPGHAAAQKLCVFFPLFLSVVLFSAPAFSLVSPIFLPARSRAESYGLTRPRRKKKRRAFSLHFSSGWAGKGSRVPVVCHSLVGCFTKRLPYCGMVRPRGRLGVAFRHGGVVELGRSCKAVRR